MLWLMFSSAGENEPMIQLVELYPNLRKAGASYVLDDTNTTVHAVYELLTTNTIPPH